MEAVVYSKDRPPNKVYPQILSALSCFFGQFSIGLTFGWLSPALVKLQEEGSSIPTTPSQGSTIVSIMVVGGIIGPVLYAWKVDIFGRRWMAFFGAIYLGTSWLIIILATEVYHIYIARIFVGFGIGYIFGLVPTYVGEIAETHLRSGFGVVAAVISSLGTVFEFAVSPHVSFFNLAIINLTFPVLMFISFFWMVESPYFLMRQGKEEEAREAVMRLRGQLNPNHVESEVRAIKIFVENSPKRPFKEILKEVMLPSNRRALFILTTLMLGQQFCGSTTIKAYFHIIIEATESPLDPDVTVLASEIVGIFILTSSIYFIERFGRRPLFLITCIGCMLSTFVTGLYFMLWSQGVIGSDTSWLAIAGLMGIQLFSSLGATSVPNTVASEMSTASIRSWFGGYKAITLSVFNSISAKLFQVTKDDLGGQYAFWMFTVVLIVVTTTIYNIMPETKGKSLQEIQDILSRNKNRTIADVESKKDVEH